MTSSYPLAPFRSVDRAKLHAVIRAYPLATLISAGAEWPTVTQVPLVLDDARGASGVLLGHFDGNNPHGEVLRADPRVYALFHGPNHYISPSIYPTEQYPGWNYVTVHVQALARPLTDRERVRDILFRLAEPNDHRRRTIPRWSSTLSIAPARATATARHTARRDPPSPSVLRRRPSDPRPRGALGRPRARQVHRVRQLVDHRRHDYNDSYAYLGGTGTGKINPNPPG
ncbi:FMN-binding negative transcriptional regulator [Nannocystis radixulma]|uniref:FMN-binding negative transcriptional regulator n=1 Tax=Nannocystis radixulma TaxID=2995305 RepID=A0ABT5B361_9BACT|nr:FMN-binding negative transcriptional regulator [Nannocystis radixulma]MDC0667964.1 FMN-binding negative transcriptional regulator [Nannocystis radixulma]